MNHLEDFVVPVYHRVKKKSKQKHRQILEFWQRAKRMKVSEIGCPLNSHQKRLGELEIRKNRDHPDYNTGKISSSVCILLDEEICCRSSICENYVDHSISFQTFLYRHLKLA